MTHELDFLKPLAIDMFPTGSRVICNPPPTDTDEDWCILFESGHFKPIEKSLRERGYYYSGKYYNKTTKFRTYRHDTNDLNLIFTRHLDWYQRFQEATRIATDENIMDKNERVELFELILGNRRPAYIETTNPCAEIPLYRQFNNGFEPAPVYWVGSSTTSTGTGLFG